MWSAALAEACARHPGLVAVHESPGGALALVLRHTLVPLPEERGAWLTETRTAAREVIHDLRGRGFKGPTVVAQWLPVQRLGYVFDTWPCRWQGDPARAARMREIVRRLLAERRFLASWRAERRRRIPAGLEPPAVRRWYCAMAPTWLGIKPEVRRQLVLQTHVWIIERALDGDAWPPPVADLAEDGALVHRLERLVPPDDRPRWSPWIAAVLAGLARELACAPERRDQRWMRRMFLVAWRVPPPSVAQGARMSAL